MDLNSVWAWIVVNAPGFGGVILPLVVTILNTNVTDSRAKFGMTLFACLVGGILYNLGELGTQTAWESGEAVLGSLALLFTQSQIVYRLFFKGSTLETKLEEKLS